MHKCQNRGMPAASKVCDGPSARHACVRMPAQATGRFAVEYEALEDVDLSEGVWVRWYTLESDPRPVATLAPHTVPISPLSAEARPTQVWPRRTRGVRRHPPRPKQEARGAGADVVADPNEDQADSDVEAGASESEGNDFEMEAELLRVVAEADELAESGFNPPESHEEGPSGAASSGGPAASAEPVAEAPAPMPPPPPQAAEGVARRPQRRGGARASAAAVCQVPGGSIGYYVSKSAFEAVCDNPAHGRCVATRTSSGRATGEDGFPRSGRPLGFLAAWLQAGQGVGSKAEHWQLFDQPHSERVRLRSEFSTSGAFQTLLAHERARAEGEPEEPRSLLGYI